MDPNHSPAESGPVPDRKRDWHEPARSYFRRAPVLFVLFLICWVNWLVLAWFSARIRGDALGIVPSVQGFLVTSHGAATHVSERVWLIALVYPFVTFMVTPMIAALFFWRIGVVTDRRHPRYVRWLVIGFFILWSILMYSETTASFTRSWTDYRQLRERRRIETTSARVVDSLQSRSAPASP